jgi:hypothetical protein
MAVPAFTTGTALTQADLSYMINAKPLFMAFQTVSQSLTSGASVPITFTTEVIDRYNMHSTSSNTSRVVIGLELGWYRVTGIAHFSTTTSGTGQSVTINKNGSIITGTVKTMFAIGINPTYVTTEAFVQSTISTDYIELVASSGVTTTTLVSGPGASSLYVEFLGT